MGDKWTVDDYTEANTALGQIKQEAADQEGPRQHPADNEQGREH